MLKNLELSGFKSFAKKSILDFKTPISAIVGPNGSGKSNIAEAFRFVLGEQSIKSMRGKRGEDLIFNGSSNTQRSNRASVKVCFDNKKRKLSLDFDEITIERVVHRDSTNEYLINGTQVRLKDVMELLGSAHIGSSGHHIISQGEADRILNIPAKERKAVVEDALGLKIYQYKKEESLRKLLKTEDNIKQVESLRREIAPHLRFLKKQVEKLEKALEMKEELGVLSREYFKREHFYLESNKRKIREERESPERELKKLQEELLKAKALMSGSGESETGMEEVSSLSKKLEDIRGQVSTLEREVGRIEGEISSAERNIRRQRENSNNEGVLTVPIAEVKTLKDEIEFFIDESNSLEDVSKLREMISRIARVALDFFDLKINKSHSEEMDALVEKDKKEIEDLKLKRGEIEEKIKEKGKERESLEERISILKEKIETEKDSFKDAEKEVYRIMAIQNELKSTVERLYSAEDRLTLEEDEYKRELAEVAGIVGRGVFDFADFPLDEEEAFGEERRIQDDRKRAVDKLKIKLEDQGVSGGDDIIKEYNETMERDSFLDKELSDLEVSAESLKALIKDLEERLSIEFKEGVEKINKEFKKFFNLMFGGGEAELLLSIQKKKKRKDTDIDLEGAIFEEDDMEDEIEEGIDINVSLPHKKTKGLMMLSGGERALTSIALLFAISQVNPPPFIILDETDAALDEANSRRYADMVKALSEHSQLILITHNRETMNVAGILYGVTMGADGVSKLLSVNFDEATSYAK